MLAVFAFANGLEALRYLLPHVPFPTELDNFTHRRVALSLHAMGGAIAPMAGPLQFLPRFRESNWNRHRPLGWIYCGGMLLGWRASVWIAPHSQTGWIAAWGFLTLDAAWIVTTALAVRFILSPKEPRPKTKGAPLGRRPLHMPTPRPHKQQRRVGHPK